LSSGERSIETHQTTARITHKIGQLVRVPDVPVVHDQHGLFTAIHGAKNGSTFADSLRKMAATHYGHAGPLFVGHLIKHYAELSLEDRLRDLLQQFGENLNDQDARVARSFALIALAGELGIEWGILPWKPQTALIAAAEIFHHWLSTQPQSVKNKEEAQLLRRVKDFIETHDAAFSNADCVSKSDEVDGRTTNQERAGYWKEEEVDGQIKRIYCFLSAGLKRAGVDFSSEEAAKILNDAGAIFKQEKNRYSHNLWVANVKSYQRCYWVDPEKLSEF
jgi:putative DNA primase/helicase